MARIKEPTLGEALSFVPKYHKGAAAPADVKDLNRNLNRLRTEAYKRIKRLEDKGIAEASAYYNSVSASLIAEHSMKPGEKLSEHFFDYTKPGASYASRAAMFGKMRGILSDRETTTVSGTRAINKKISAAIGFTGTEKEWLAMAPGFWKLYDRALEMGMLSVGRGSRDNQEIISNFISGGSFKTASGEIISPRMLTKALGDKSLSVGEKSAVMDKLMGALSEKLGR